jgi:lysophospholipid hydrolase
MSFPLIFETRMLIFAVLGALASWVVRYRLLNMYSRLPPEPQRKEPDIDLFPDTHDEGTKSGLSSYLDEFLSAIKIFGYLERPVFHELTRSMQTRKLIAGETFNLEEEKGFCMVVDGEVEIFVKSGPNVTLPQSDPCLLNSAASSPTDGEDESGLPHQRYQLLTEVRNGAPMSSLFSIMSLFTEDVKLRTEDDNSEPTSGSNLRHSPFPRSAGFRMPSDVAVSFPGTPHSTSESMKVEGVQNGGALPKIPPISLDTSSATHPMHRPNTHPRAMSMSAHPDVIARATVDTTIAIIPASAFRRLITVYPKATAQIVHVILSRFQRVTLASAYTYLGLTGEVLQTEKNMIKYTTYQLPNVLRGDALTRLKEKFNQERERIGTDEEGKGIALHNAAAGRRRSSSTTLRKEVMLQSMTKQRPVSVAAASSSASLSYRLARPSPSPGDLLTNIQLARGSSQRVHNNMEFPMYQMTDAMKAEGVSPLAQRSFNPFNTQAHGRASMDRRETVDEDNLFRASILECMFKAIGLGNGDGSSKDPQSMEGSPRVVGYDSRRQKPGFSNNAFGLIGPYDDSADGESESVTSSNVAMQTPPNAHILANDMKDELEIVFFPKGSVLVEQGERNPGLYYVVDGFLDICTSTAESSTSLLHPGKGSRTFPMDPFGYNHDPAPPSPPVGNPDLGRGIGEGKKKAEARRRSVALIKPGGLAGYIGSVSSYRSFIDVVAKTDVYVGFLPRASLERIVDRYPTVLLTMAKRLTNLLPRLILHIDFALEWVQVNAGQVIFHNGDESEAIYIVLNGRLRLVEDKKDGGVSVRAEFGQGESVGELEVLTESARTGTLHAIRDTELVKFPRTLFNSLAQEHPNITIKISKIIASRMRSLVDDPSGFLGKELAASPLVSKGSSTMNLRTVAVLPVTSGVPIIEFGNRLMNALAQVGPTNGATTLNQSAILNHLGRHAFNKMGKLKLAQYLADLEEKYGLVVYVAGK